MPKTKKPKLTIGKKLKNVDLKIKNLQKFVDKTIEKKSSDFWMTSAGGDTISTGYNRYLAVFRTPEAESAADGGRIADKVTLMSQRILGNLSMPTTGEDYVRVRLIIVENVGFDSASDIELTDVLEYGDYAVNGNRVFSSPYKRVADNSKKYRRLFDKVYHMTKQNKPYVNFQYTRNYGKTGRVVNFAGSADTIPVDLRLAIFVISDSAVTPHPRLEAMTRNVYRDA